MSLLYATRCCVRFFMRWCRLLVHARGSPRCAHPAKAPLWRDRLLALEPCNPRGRTPAVRSALLTGWHSPRRHIGCRYPTPPGIRLSGIERLTNRPARGVQLSRSGRSQVLIPLLVTHFHTHGHHYLVGGFVSSPYPVDRPHLPASTARCQVESPGVGSANCGTLLPRAQPYQFWWASRPYSPTIRA